jgi:NitT/TauT family transport system permease protein
VGDNKSKKSLLVYLFSLLGIVTIFLVWYLVSFILHTKDNFGVPYPHESVSLAFSYLFGEGATATWRAIFWTLLRIFIGLALSFVLGAIFGILAGLYRPFRHFVKPGVNVLRAIPTVAVVLVLVSIIMGGRAHEWLSWIPVALTFVVAFPLYFEAFQAGILNEDKDVIDSLSIDGALRKVETIRQVYLPYSWPYIKMSLAQSVGLGFKVSIMAEVLTSTSAGNKGLGTLIVLARQSDGGVEQIPAYALIALLLMALLDLPFFVLKSKRNS